VDEDSRKKKVAFLKTIECYAPQSLALVMLNNVYIMLHPLTIPLQYIPPSMPLQKTHTIQYIEYNIFKDYFLHDSI